MRCPDCATDNREGRKFCGNCGVPLSRRCPGCGTPARDGERFCGECGRSLATDTSHETLPMTFEGGRYVVRRFLGEGGRKRVWLAHDGRLDRDVAFALVRIEGMGEGGAARVEREVQSMGRLGDHPCIVTVFDSGRHDTAPYIVSQFMDGGSVEDLLESAPDRRLEVRRALEIARQVCEALDHAHAHGIVHRDVKPGNIWLTATGAAKLGDFGLAVALDRSRLTQEGMIVGTAHYMPPEQALGRAPDARSDLYALGCCIYEMVCGRPPFLGDDAVAVISQHINTPPVPPSLHTPSVSAALDTLILALLAKAPDSRPPSARAVADELSHIAEVPVPPADDARPLPAEEALRRVPWGRFVGRRSELDRLIGMLDAAVHGRASLVMVAGEPGIGKTRIVEELAVHAGLRGAQVVWGHCREDEAGLPYLPFVEALRELARTRDDSTLRAELGDGAPEIARLVSEIRARLPGLPDAPALEEEAERLRLFESVAGMLDASASARPLVLVLDDLHWADRPSLLMLRHLARRLAGCAVLILGTYRDVELDRAHPLSEALGELRREAGFERIVLRGLPREDVKALVEALGEQETNRPFADAIWEETEGNPFFVQEVLRHLVEEGTIFLEDGHWTSRAATIAELGIPEGVKEVIGRRLSRLSADCNQVLTVASTVRSRFDWTVLREVTGLDTDVLADVLDEAMRAGLIRELAGGSYQFTHALVRQTLYDELNTPRRVQLHGRVGEAIQRLHAGNIEPHLAELANHMFHAAPAGEAAKAVDYARRAADRAVATYAWDEAARLYEMAVQAADFLPEPDERLRAGLLIDLAAAKSRSGAADAALQTLDRAWQEVQAAEDRELVARFAREYYEASNRSSTAFAGHALPVLRRTLDLVGSEDSPERATVLSALAAVSANTFRTDSLEIAREGMAVAERTGDPAQMVYSLRVLVNTLSAPEHAAQREREANRLVREARLVGNRAAEAWGHLVLAACFLARGDVDELDRQIERTNAVAAVLRDPMFDGWRPTWLAMRAAMEGRYEEADAHSAGVIDTFNRTQMQGYFQAWAVLLYDIRRAQGRIGELIDAIRMALEQAPTAAWEAALAMALAETGRLDEARDPYERARLDDLPQDINWLVTHYLLVYCARDLGDPGTAQRLYSALLPYREQCVQVGYGILYAGCVGTILGVAAASTGDTETAQAHFEDAIAFERRARAWPWLARAQAEYADLLLARGEQAKALGLVTEALDTAQRLGMAALVQRCLGLKLRAQGVDPTDLRTSITAVASIVQIERPDLRPHAAPDGTVTILFSDIEGSTELNERLGDLRWMDVLRDHNATIRERVLECGGYEVKSEGDGFMVAFASARRALDCAMAIERAFAGHDSIKVRIGLHTGEALKEGDDFFGRNVTLAARIASQARGGEILVSSLVKALTDSAGDIRFSSERHVELKGLSGTHAIHTVDWS